MNQIKKWRARTNKWGVCAFFGCCVQDAEMLTCFESGSSDIVQRRRKQPDDYSWASVVAPGAREADRRGAVGR